MEIELINYTKGFYNFKDTKKCILPISEMGP